MKIAVVGTVMRDDIRTPDGARRESFGGILYNAMALAAMVRASDRIVPVCFLAREHIETLRGRHLSGHAQIATGSIRACAAGTDENLMEYRNGTERSERLTLRTPPFEVSDLAECEDSHALLVNFVSGREMELGTFRLLRRMTRGLLHLDVHNLVRRVDDEGRLVPAVLPDWRDWLAQVDTVQANEAEAGFMLGDALRTEDDRRAAAVEMLAPRNVRAAAITLGAEGCVVAHRLALDGAVRVVRLPAIADEQVSDTTGCGDCWSAGFVVGMLRHRNPARAALLATAVAGLNAAEPGIDGLAGRARRIEETLQRRFGDALAMIDRGWLGEPA